MPTRAEYALFGANAYGRAPGKQAQARLPGPWKRVSYPSAIYLEIPVTGFRAHVYHNEATKEVVIAFAGTHIADQGDLSAIGRSLQRASAATVS